MEISGKCHEGGSEYSKFDENNACLDDWGLDRVNDTESYSDEEKSVCLGMQEKEFSFDDLLDYDFSSSDSFQNDFNEPKTTQMIPVQVDLPNYLERSSKRLFKRSGSGWKAFCFRFCF